jgi:choline dehydrogenase-like flavoprotein
MEKYDAIIVGAGVGGCTVAYRLASVGKRVLLVDKGKLMLSRGQEINESVLFSNNEYASRLVKIPFALGYGGNSLIYGGQLSRFDKSCFENAENKDYVFPFSYSEIAPYYKEIEDKFEALEPDLTPAENQMVAAFEYCGFEKISNVQAVNFVEGCDGCGGKICDRACKKDFFSVLCLDLVQRGLLDVSEMSEVIQLKTNFGKVDEVKLRVEGDEVMLQTQALIISTGTLRTPSFIRKHLFDVLSPEYCDVVGSGVTFHISDFYLLFPRFILKGSRKRTKILNGRLPRICNNGVNVPFTLQSVGAPVEAEYVKRFLLRRTPVQFSRSKIFSTLIHHFSSFAGYLGKKAHVVASIIQDPVSQLNTVSSCDERPLSVNYSLSTSFKYSVNAIDSQIKRALRKKFFVFRLGNKGNINYGHPMGGCAMGASERFAVTPDGRLRSTKNVYIADASVFPVSGDTNPSLTIAAIALHTADRLLRQIS